MGPASTTEEAAQISADDQQLLRELNGIADAAEPRALDEQTQAPDLTSLLEMKPAALKVEPAAPLAAKADKSNSVAAGGRGYKVVISGEYYAKSVETKGNVVKHYELPFNLPSLTNAKGESPLAILLRASTPEHSLLMRALKKLDPLYLAVRTHFVKSVTALNGAPQPASLQYASMRALADYAREHELGIDPDQYWDVEHLREDVIFLVTNQVDNKDARTGEKLSDAIKDGKGLGVKKSPLEMVKERHQERMDAKALLDFNPGL